MMSASPTTDLLRSLAAWCMKRTTIQRTGIQTMPLVIQILCDRCKVPKQATNHWYTVTIRQRSFEVGPLTLKPDGRPAVEREGLQYFCGRYCVLEAFNLWMEELSGQPSPDPLLQSENPHIVLHDQAPTSRPSRPSKLGGPPGQPLPDNVVRHLPMAEYPVIRGKYVLRTKYMEVFR